ncbi:hypothetical protein M413DRAFT_448055 [Hebeloma cylindrosporum]|uniref:Uncharacterized protein n=1 Tax=Hebeloma cylindrosporum TaxID=76867 RepID=A0A0C2XJQ7_HEBCY|nr:hypothetical protein M413DRAFT_448055 [Hebeloma cylindrosporum h7]
MATFVVKHAGAALRQASSSRSAIFQRKIHSTAVVSKKKSKAIVDDLFGDDVALEDDLIKEESVPAAKSRLSTKPVSSKPSTPATPIVKKISLAERRKLSPEKLSERFEATVKYMEPRIGRKPSVAHPLVRKRAFLTLLDYARSEEHLRKIMELIPRFREARGDLHPDFAVDFTRRCQELQCPHLALELFGNFAKYNVHLNLEAGQWLIHSLYVLHPLEQVLVATRLFTAYNLPPISKDLPTASMVAAACYKHGTPEALDVARALRPEIRKMVKRAKLSKAGTLEERKKNKWVSWSLQKVNKAAKRLGEEAFASPKQIPLKIEVNPVPAQP